MNIEVVEEKNVLFATFLFYRKCQLYFAFSVFKLSAFVTMKGNN